MDAIDRWLAAAVADAARRGLPELTPLLEGLAISTRALRGARWNDVADGGAQAPPGPSDPGEPRS